MITLHRSGQYRFYVNSGYSQESPYICVKHQGHFAKFSLKPVALTANNGFTRTEIGRLLQTVSDAREHLLRHWASRNGDAPEKPTGELLLQQQD